MPSELGGVLRHRSRRVVVGCGGRAIAEALVGITRLPDLRPLGPPEPKATGAASDESKWATSREDGAVLVLPGGGRRPSSPTAAFRVKVVAVDGRNLRPAIEAPKEASVVREEL